MRSLSRILIPRIYHPLNQRITPRIDHCKHIFTQRPGPQYALLQTPVPCCHLYDGAAGRDLFEYGFRKLSTNMSPQRYDLNIWVSTSNNIYSNLALEDWLYKEEMFEKQRIVLLWRNAPCVVIGRHQNPWAECDITGCQQDGVNIARRNSGGGAVYHDLGNMCISFFTTRSDYDRKENLQLIVDAVTGRWPIDLRINDRDDIIIDNTHKISGTAAKLGSKTAYHHCTLLTGVNKDNLHRYLTTKMIGIDSRATESVRSAVYNLSEADPSINFETLVDAIGQKFREDSEKEVRIEYIDPECTARFPGLSSTRAQLQTPEWIFLRTPTFSLQRTFIDNSNTENSFRNLDVHLQIVKGRLSTVQLDGQVVQGHEPMCDMMISLIRDQYFDRDVINALLQRGYNNVIGIESAQVYLYIWQCFRSIFL